MYMRLFGYSIGFAVSGVFVGIPYVHRTGILSAEKAGYFGHRWAWVLSWLWFEFEIMELA